MPTRIAFPMPEITMPTKLGVEEQYEIKERKALAITTSESSHTITTSNPKIAICIAKGCDMQADTASITVDSPPILDKSAFTFTLKGVATTIYGKALSGSGTLYIVVLA